MEWTPILYAALSIGGLGLLFGIGLGIAAKKFAVTVDPLVPQIRDNLPGANCGGCGYAGCDAFAKLVASGEVEPGACPVNSPEAAENIAKLLGIEVSKSEKKIAFVKCMGTFDNASEKYEYYGIRDCKQANLLQGKGSKGCQYGCLGLSSCVNACMFDALHIKDGIAVVDEEKCTACGLCVNTCPKALIELIPAASSNTRVMCNSLDKGKEVKTNCKVGCIGCTLCTKVCEYDAIHMHGSLAKIDYDKCVSCGACVTKCPTNAILPDRTKVK